MRNYCQITQSIVVMQQKMTDYSHTNLSYNHIKMLDVIMYNVSS